LVENNGDTETDKTEENDKEDLIKIKLQYVEKSFHLQKLSIFSVFAVSKLDYEDGSDLN
jgi:hypothetical protein